VIRLTSTEVVEFTTPNGVWLVDPVARTVDEGQGPRPFNQAEEAMIPSVAQIEAWAAETALANVNDPLFALERTTWTNLVSTNPLDLGA
jgi:hypothetical protein